MYVRNVRPCVEYILLCFLFLILVFFANCVKSKQNTDFYHPTRFTHNKLLADDVPWTYRGKTLEPIIPGDFSEYMELWSGDAYKRGENNLMVDLFLLKSKHRHRKYDGMKVDTMSVYGTDMRLRPIPDRDWLLMSNWEQLQLYTLWGTRNLLTNYSNHQFDKIFVHNNWLFINRSNALDLNQVMNSPRHLTSQTGIWNYRNVPESVMDTPMLEYVAAHCFDYKFYCTFDPDEGNLLMNDGEVLLYRYGLKLIMFKADYTTNNVWRQPYYVVEDDITGLAFYIPSDLETFTRPPNFSYKTRYALIPIFGAADRFITTRRHQIFVKNNRNDLLVRPINQPRITPEPCECDPTSERIFKSSATASSWAAITILLSLRLSLSNTVYSNLYVYAWPCAHFYLR